MEANDLRKNSVEIQSSLKKIMKAPAGKTAVRKKTTFDNI